MEQLNVLHGCATIKVGGNRNALVEVGDVGALLKWTWYPLRTNGDTYAISGRPATLMHRMILDAPDDIHVDHRNGDTLDNRRGNLRPATHGQNMANRKKHRNGTTSRFKGVHRKKNMTKWRAVIGKDGVVVHLGYFDDELDAAHAYDRAAREMFGEFARTNFEADIASIP